MRYLVMSILLGVICLGCADNAGIEGVAPIDVMLAEPIGDYGALHNAILSEMGVGADDSRRWSRNEYFRLLTAAANRAYAQYGPSREFSVSEVRELVVGIATKIELTYDPTNRDPERAEPISVLDRFLANGKLAQAEYDQLALLFSPEKPRQGLQLVAAIESAPVSELVGHGVSIFNASLDFWTGGQLASMMSAQDPDAPLHEDDLAKKIRTGWGDALGGVIAAGLGAGIFSPLVGAALSTAFHIDEGCLGCGDGGSGASNDTPCRRGPCP